MKYFLTNKGVRRSRPVPLNILDDSLRPVKTIVVPKDGEIEVTESELKSVEVQKALSRKFIGWRVEADAPAPVKPHAPVKAPAAPVTPAAPAVPKEESSAKPTSGKGKKPEGDEKPQG